MTVSVCHNIIPLFGSPLVQCDPLILIIIHCVSPCFLLALPLLCLSHLHSSIMCVNQWLLLLQNGVWIISSSAWSPNPSLDMYCHGGNSFICLLTWAFPLSCSLQTLSLSLCVPPSSTVSPSLQCYITHTISLLSDSGTQGLISKESPCLWVFVCHCLMTCSSTHHSHDWLLAPCRLDSLP